MSTRFDSTGCINALKAYLLIAMIDLKHELFAEAQQKMLTPEGRNDLKEEDAEIIATFISVSVVGGPWATMDEWGTGSLLDEDNPALDDYKSSDMWNPARHDNKIRTRPNAPGQKDIFGKPVNGRGNGGFDLEAAGRVSPQPPSHALQTAARWMQNGRMRSRIKETIASFPFGKFIIVDKK